MEIKINKKYLFAYIIAFIFASILLVYKTRESYENNFYSNINNYFIELNGDKLISFLSQKADINTVYQTFRTQSSLIGIYSTKAKIVQPLNVENVNTLNVRESNIETPRFSKTNVRTLGVDEPDYVKTDGRYIYLLNRYSGNYYKVFAYPPENLSVKGKIKLRARDILVYKGETIAFSQKFENREFKAIGDVNLKFSAPETCIEILNSNLKAEKEFCILGYYRTARLLEKKGIAYVISYYPINNYPLLPQIIEGNKTILVKKAYSPKNLTKIDNIIIITEINLKNNNHKSIALFSQGYNPIIYASPNNLYIVSYEGKTYYSYYPEFIVWFTKEYLPKTNFWEKLPKTLRESIEKIVNTNISNSAKAKLLEQLLREYNITNTNDYRKLVNNALFEFLKGKEKSIIIKVGLDSFKPIAIGEVPGKLINQFAIDEYKNYTRVATTLSFGIFGIETFNNIYVLDSNLKTIGKLEGLEKGERIYSVLFYGDKAYLVTYRQIDPFLVIDLSNPEKPKVLGKLEIPGYYTYLYPIDKNKILAIGKENYYVKVSLYDVTNPENPKELSKVLIEGNSQIANVWNVDYKAFLYDKEKSLIFIPVRTIKYKCFYPIPIPKPPITIQNEKTNVILPEPPISPIEKCFFELGKYDRVVVIKINKDKLEKIAELNHTDVSRELFIGDYIYTVSPWEIKAWSENNWKLVKDLKLENPIPIYRIMIR